MSSRDLNQRIQKLPESVRGARFGLAWIGSLFHLDNSVTAKTLEGEYKQLWDRVTP